MLERLNVEDAQSFTAGDLVELANLIADHVSAAKLTEALDLLDRLVDPLIDTVCKRRVVIWKRVVRRDLIGQGGRHPDNELRRTLWALADKWDRGGGLIERECAGELRAALTYPAADQADEQLLRIFGKTSDELADEAEAGYPINYTGLDRSFDDRGMGL